MKTYKLHSGLYGQKAKAIVSICKKLRNNMMPISRRDIYEWDRRMLFQNDDVNIIYNGDELSITFIHDNQHNIKRDEMLKRAVNNFFSDNCLLFIDMNQYDEVTLLIKADGYNAPCIETWLKAFYAGMICLLDIFVNELKTYFTMKLDDKFTIRCTHDLEAVDRPLNFSIGYVRLKDERVEMTLSDIEDMIEVAENRLNTLRRNQPLWLPGKDEENLQKAVGSSQEDPFQVCKNELLIEAETKKLDSLLQAFDEEFKKYEQACFKLKSAANDKILEKFSIGMI